MTFSRVYPAGWIQETSSSLSRVTPTGWLQETSGAVNSQGLLPTLYNNSTTFFSSTITSSIVLSPGLYSNSPTLFIPSLTSIVNLYVDLLANSSVFYGGVLVVDLELSNIVLFINTNLFFTPLISITTVLEVPFFINNILASITGDVTLSPQTIADLTDSIVTALMLEIDARRFLTTNKYLALK